MQPVGETTPSLQIAVFIKIMFSLEVSGGSEKETHPIPVGGNYACICLAGVGTIMRDVWKTLK